MNLIRKILFDSPIVLASGVVRVTDEELNDVIDPWTDCRAAFVDFVEVDKGAVQSKRARVDELCNRCAKAVRITNVLKPIHGPHKPKVSRCRDEGKLACEGRGISSLSGALLSCKPNSNRE